MMNAAAQSAVSPIPADAAPRTESGTEPNASPRHARLFELIRQQNLAARQRVAPATASTERPAPSAAGETAQQDAVQKFSQDARRSLLPQEQQVLGITSSFGR